MRSSRRKALERVCQCKGSDHRRPRLHWLQPCPYPGNAGANVTLVDSLIPQYGGNPFNIDDILQTKKPPAPAGRVQKPRASPGKAGTGSARKRGRAKRPTAGKRQRLPLRGRGYEREPRQRAIEDESTQVATEAWTAPRVLWDMEIVSDIASK